MWDADTSFPKAWHSPLFISYFEITAFTIGTKSSIKKKKERDNNTSTYMKIIVRGKYFWLINNAH